MHDDTPPAVSDAEALFARGNALIEQQDLESAARHFAEAVRLEPSLAAAHGNLGVVLCRLDRTEEAIPAYDAAIALAPDDLSHRLNRAIALASIHRLDEAIAECDRMLSRDPGHLKALIQRGDLLQRLGRAEQAIESYDRVLQFEPEHAHAHNNRGVALKALGRIEESLAEFEWNSAHHPTHADAHFNRANLLRQLGRMPEALEAYTRTAELDPQRELLLGDWLHTRMHLSDWGGIEPHIADLRARALQPGLPTTPFPLLSLVDDPLAHRAIARAWADARFKLPVTPLAPTAPARGRRIRIGYFSADFHEHATSQLMVHLFERHDRSRFELYAFSFGPDLQDAMRQRVARAFDHFLDVRSQSDLEVAMLSRHLGIDIAVDLKGYTGDARTGIFAHRAAAVQVNYLGYPGTMGAPFIDYLIGDPVVTPREARAWYDEKIVNLPHCYQVNDRQRKISDRVFSRAELGLPEDAFVFCSFNSCHKILPEWFDHWMRLLREMPGSVFWLLRDNEVTSAKLQKEAAARGVDPTRLIFAGRMPLGEHLARQRAADLFLDTFPYNAHTTASDALWAGLPVLTCAGRSFASRVAASLLHSIGLPELVTTQPEEFVARALTLARDPQGRLALREKLARQRLSTPLFDTDRFTRDIERAFEFMVERRDAGLAPDHCDLPPRATDFAQALQRGVQALHSGRLSEALDDFRSALEWAPDDADAHNNAGAALQALGRHADAVPCHLEAIRLRPGMADARNNLAVALGECGRREESLEAYDSALQIDANHRDALRNSADLLMEMGRLEEAVARYRELLRRHPDDLHGLNHLGLALGKLQRFEEALHSLDQAVALRPQWVDARMNRALAFLGLRQFDRALEETAEILREDPRHAEAWCHRASTFVELHRTEEALACFDQAIAADPTLVNAHHGRASLLRRAGHMEAAAQGFARTLELAPGRALVLGDWVHTRMYLCDWRDLDALTASMLSALDGPTLAAMPFVLLGLVDDPRALRDAARQWVQSGLPPAQARPIPRPATGRGKIRLGYFSADFHEHATCHLMAQLFECHDRSRFEVHAFSFGPDANDRMRQRVRQAFDHFHDVRLLPDADVARRSRDLGIDIAIDLKGFTGEARTAIFAHGAAPLQVNYLGFPGTLGAPFIDYLIGDPVLIPEDCLPFYDEKIVFLPDSYQVNDRTRAIAETRPSRAELGLPEDAFVFCSFNSSFKITPPVFGVWMRLLREIPGSVLWLRETSPESSANLRREARLRDIDPARLIFAPRLPLAEHLARHHAADLFLDSFPCNAHTTASDALWAGLPVLTCAGSTLASRVAASLLNAIGLPELITSSLEEYESRARTLALQPAQLAALRHRLAQNRLTTPLFDTTRFARHLEKAFEAMIARQEAGLAPDHLRIAASDAA